MIGVRLGITIRLEITIRSEIRVRGAKANQVLIDVLRITSAVVSCPTNNRVDVFLIGQTWVVQKYCDHRNEISSGNDSV